LVPRLVFVVSLVASGFAASSACNDDGRSVGVESDDGGGADPLVDGGAADTAAEPPFATMRLAHLAPGASAIDFCYQGARSGGTVGPVRKAAAADGGDGGDAGERGLAYGEVTRYIDLETSGPLSIAIVGASATSCASPLAVAEVTLDPGKRSTVALFGRTIDGGPPPLTAFVDDPNTSGSKARVRLVHGAPRAGAVSARVVTNGTTLLAERVEPRRASSPSAIVPVDTLGYATIAPISVPAAIAVDFLDAGTLPWQSTARDLSLGAGSLHTGFVIDDGTPAIDLVWCADEQIVGERTSCTLVP
jgi:hypothetical protein